MRSEFGKDFARYELTADDAKALARVGIGASTFLTNAERKKNGTVVVEFPTKHFWRHNAS